MSPATQPANLTQEESILWRVSLSSLERFVLGDAGILSRQLIWDGGELLPLPEPSPRNTAELAKALYLFRDHGLPCPLDPDALLDRIMTRYLATLEYPDVALTLWADALGGGRYLATLWEELTQRLPRRDTDTMHLAWALSAVCHCFPLAAAPPRVASLADELFTRIRRNQSGTTGLFHASGRRARWLRRRERVATLAVQTYPIQALALYGKVFRVPEAVELAERCAERLCRLQGPQGQWWRSYDVLNGELAVTYPVYSVNQDGSVPMALDELHAAAGHGRYRAHISRGLAWVLGNNELGASLVDEAMGIIWSGVARSDDGDFLVVREVYSYHPARCLYWLSARGR